MEREKTWGDGEKKKTVGAKITIQRHEMEKKDHNECVGSLGFKLSDIVDQMHPFIPMIHSWQVRHYRHSISLCLTDK